MIRNQVLYSLSQLKDNDKKDNMDTLLSSNRPLCMMLFYHFLWFVEEAEMATLLSLFQRFFQIMYRKIKSLKHIPWLQEDKVRYRPHTRNAWFFQS